MTARLLSARLQTIIFFITPFSALQTVKRDSGGREGGREEKGNAEAKWRVRKWAKVDNKVEKRGEHKGTE